MPDKETSGTFDEKQVVLFFPDIAKHTKSQPNPSLLFFLDVATKYTGYALFEVSSLDPSTAILAGYGVIKANTGAHVNDRMRAITAKVSNLIHTLKPGHLVMEYPCFQAGEKGVSAAHGGATIKLAHLCGRIEACWEYYLAMIFARNKDNAQAARIAQMFKYAALVTFPQWNGQTPKRVTCQRCTDHFGLTPNPESIDNNWADAVMMGRWYCKNVLMLETAKNASAERVDL